MTLPRVQIPTYHLSIPSSKKKITYRPFLVKEEKILLMAMESASEKDMASALNQIITNCILSKDFDVSELATFDIEYIFLQLRSKSVGEIAEPIIHCEKCEKDVPLEIDLSKVKMKFTKSHKKDIQLDKEIGVTMKYPDIVQLAEYGLSQTDGQGSETIEKVYSLIKSCVESIWTSDERYQMRDTPDEELEDFLSSLGTDHYQKIQEFFDTMPALEHKAKYKCEHCEFEGTVIIRGLQDFFI